LHPEREKLIKDIQKLMEERGRKPLEMARKAILEEKIESKEVKEALHYFMTKYWQDLARPTLMSICCEAVGGDPNATIPFAVPLSLISGALDIQDDIIDQSKTKHGQPTVYGKYGKEIAILAADALIFKGFESLHEACINISKERANKIMRIIKDMFYELGDAEALELKLRRKLDVDPKEYLYIVEKKAADIEAHTYIAGILSTTNHQKIKELAMYGRLVGSLVIIRDDILDVMDENELKNRILKEHLPLPVLYAYSKDEETMSELRKILRKRKIIKSDTRKIQKIVNKSDGFKTTLNVLRKLFDRASKVIRKFDCYENLDIFISSIYYEVETAIN